MPGPGPGKMARCQMWRVAAHRLLPRGLYPAAPAQPGYFLQQKRVPGVTVPNGQRGAGRICQGSAVAVGRADRLDRKQ